jgi:hypothetical protein
MDIDQPFVRNPSLLSKSAIEKSTAAKYRLSNFYKQLVDECADREQRYNDLMQTSRLRGGNQERDMVRGKEGKTFSKIVRERVRVSAAASSKTGK